MHKFDKPEHLHLERQHAPHRLVQRHRLSPEVEARHIVVVIVASSDRRIADERLDLSTRISKQQIEQELREKLAGMQIKIAHEIEKMLIERETTIAQMQTELNKIEGNVVNMQTLEKANIIDRSVERARIMLSGEVSRSFTVEGIAVTKGAKTAIEAAGGKIS